jgi:septal ring factor EnvC (AmiA/AmiB activator)
VSWPLAEQSRRPAALSQPKHRTPRVMWAVVAAAFVCGAATSAAAFSIGWKHQAQKGTSAESALVAATANLHTLRTRLSGVRTQLAAERSDAAALAAARRAAVRTNARLRAKNAAAQQTLASLNVAAGRLGDNLDRLTNELRALTSYVTTTPAGQLDAGYVQAQLAYLAKTVDRFRAAVAALGSS